MYKFFMISFNNIKKKKGDTAVLILLTMLSAILIYTSISVLTGAGKVIDDVYDNANTADYIYATYADSKDEIKELLSSQEEVEDYETSEVYGVNAQYHRFDETKKHDFVFLLNNVEEKRNISKIGDGYVPNMSKDGILLPYILSSSFKKGEKFYLIINNREYEFIVDGFVEDAMFSTTMGISVYNVYFMESLLQEIVKDIPSLKDKKAYMHKMKISDSSKSGEFDSKVSALMAKEMPEIADQYIFALYWTGMRMSSLFMPYITMGIIMAFSILIIFVMLIIVRFNIRNFIEKNIRNIGIMQAAGYTAKQLRLSVVFEIGIVNALGIFLGIIIALSVNGFVGNIMSILIGLKWNQGINIFAIIITVLSVFFILVFTAWFSGRIYSRVTVLDALRGGIHTHNFNKNVFSFSKSRLPIPIILSCKEIYGEKKKNLSILFISIILSMATCIGLMLYENFALNPENILVMSGLEVANIEISISASDKETKLKDVGSQIECWKEVDRVLYYVDGVVKITNKDKTVSISADIWDKPDKLKNEMLLEGRFPEHDNEIVISTNSAEEIDVKTGDVVYVEGTAGKKDYIVTGIDQKINNMGRKALMHIEGFKRLNGDVSIKKLYVYTKEGISYKDIDKKIKEEFSQVDTANPEKETMEILSGIVKGMFAVCTLFIIVTCFVVILIEMLLIHSKISKEYKNYGINKALGYTTKQLMVQTMFANIPVISIGSVLGAAISGIAGKYLTAVCLASFGIKEVKMSINPFWELFAVAGIILVALISSFVAAVKIRKIEPVEMLRNYF